MNPPGLDGHLDRAFEVKVDADAGRLTNRDLADCVEGLILEG